MRKTGGIGNERERTRWEKVRRRGGERERNLENGSEGRGGTEYEKENEKGGNQF